MSWDPTVASNYARQNALSTSHGQCAAYVRMALNAGGQNIAPVHYAKDYGPVLERNGFVALGSGQTLKAGDVVVIQPYQGGNPAGHIAIYDGSIWYSDFRQRDMWGGPGYRHSQPPHQIFRRD